MVSVIRWIDKAKMSGGMRRMTGQQHQVVTQVVDVLLFFFIVFFFFRERLLFYIGLITIHVTCLGDRLATQWLRRQAGRDLGVIFQRLFHRFSALIPRRIRTVECASSLCLMSLQRNASFWPTPWLLYKRVSSCIASIFSSKLE